MKSLPLMLGCLLAGVIPAAGADDSFDRLDEALTWSGNHDLWRERLSGSLDLEGYYFQLPAPGLIHADRGTLLEPRLALFLDAQLGPRIYIFAQSRVDRGFDPGEGGLRARLDEYAVRVTPWAGGLVNLQFGKFATIAGNWARRHQSWDNPFITAPLPYDNLTGIFDGSAANSAPALLRWSHLGPTAIGSGEYFGQYRSPVLWGPSYASGASVSGAFGRFDYALELKNASLSSRPDSWDATRIQWSHPTFTGRLGYRPDESWDLGLSASSGPYLQPSAAPTLAAGYGLGDYREVVFGQDVGFAWHHLQFWAECYEATFEIPRVGNAGTVAYYLEAKYKFTPQCFGALRWNQQLYGTIPDGLGGNVPWGPNVWRIDVAPGYRFTAHAEVKLQLSLLHGSPGPREYSRLSAAQFVLRF